MGYIIKDISNDSTRLYSREQTIVLAERNQISNCLCELKNNSVDIKIKDISNRFLDNIIDLGGMKYIKNIDKRVIISGDTKDGFYRFCIELLTVIADYNQLYNKDIILDDIIIEQSKKENYYVHIITKNNRLMCCVSLETNTLTDYTPSCNILIPSIGYLDINKKVNFRDKDERYKMIQSLVKVIHSLYSSI